MLASCSLLWVVLWSAVCHSQVVFKRVSEYLHMMPSVQDLSTIPVIVLDHDIDNEALSRLHQLRESSSSLTTGEYTFGRSIPVSIGLDRGVWMEQDGVNRWQLKIQSPGALSVNLIFSQFFVPPGAELYIRSSVAQNFGPFTHENVKESGSFAIVPHEGDWLVLDYFAPVSSIKPQIHISSLVHGFRSAFASGDSGKCNINVACGVADKWREQSRSVAMILTADGQGFCSGAMVNNARNDGRQLFLTAFHCVGHSDTSNNMLLFNYEARACNGTGINAPRENSAHGLKKIAQWRDSDFALLELIEAIPDDYNVFLSGWSAQIDNPILPAGIHHPSGDVKKISISSWNATQACWGWCDKTDPQNHWKIPRWTRGTTEPGSSGSPLFDGAGRLVGQLHGGSAACRQPTGYDMYGQLYHSFYSSPSDADRLAPHLDPDNRGIVVIDGMELNKHVPHLQLQV